MRAYTARNAERNRERCRSYYAKNREARLAKQAEYAANNQERVKQYQVGYAKSEEGRRRRTASTHKRRAAKAASVIKATAAQIASLFASATRCFYCSRAFGEGRCKATLEHRVALSRGGTHDIDNLVIACFSCNARKSARPEAEFLKMLEAA